MGGGTLTPVLMVTTNLAVVSCSLDPYSFSIAAALGQNKFLASVCWGKRLMRWGRGRRLQNGSSSAQGYYYQHSWQQMVACRTGFNEASSQHFFSHHFHFTTLHHRIIQYIQYYLGKLSVTHSEQSNHSVWMPYQTQLLDHPGSSNHFHLLPICFSPLVFQSVFHR